MGRANMTLVEAHGRLAEAFPSRTFSIHMSCWRHVNDRDEAERAEVTWGGTVFAADGVNKIEWVIPDTDGAAAKTLSELVERLVAMSSPMADASASLEALPPHGDA